MTDTEIAWGTREHAEDLTHGRHRGIADGLQWLTPAHLPEPLRKYSAPFYAAAVALLKAVPTDSPELTNAMTLLRQAKNEAVCAGIRNDTGRAGSVPRPQEVVDPPLLAQTSRTIGTHPAVVYPSGVQSDALHPLDPPAGG